MGSRASTQSQQQTSTNTIDERIASADQAVAVRGGGDASTTTVNYQLTTVPNELLLALASGAKDLAENLTSEFAGNVSTLAQNYSGSIGSLKQTELTGGASDLQRTVLIGLVIGVGAVAVLTLKR
jgi:hypothetical protein